MGRGRSRQLGLRRRDQAHAHVHLQDAANETVENAFGRGHVLVIASHSDRNMVVSGKGLVGGIETNPAEAGQPALYPRVGGALRRLRRNLRLRQSRRRATKSESVTKVSACSRDSPETCT